MMNNPVETLVPPISDAECDDFAALFAAVYPEQVPDLTAYAENVRRQWQSPEAAESGHKRYIVRHAGQLVANASLYPKRIHTSRGEELIAGMADVLTHPDMRGRGYGSTVVRPIFDLVDSGHFAFSLFQTATARLFYEKLGCVLVTQPIINSRAENPKANPFWEKYVMAYVMPGKTLPPAEIDLVGPGY
jgi:GNAT superfamily N-acetyltransferase